MQTCQGLAQITKHILAAHHQRRHENPIDYIYRSLGCKILPASEKSDPDLILAKKYFMNSCTPAQAKSAQFFRVETGVGETFFGSKFKPGRDMNRKLLWKPTSQQQLAQELHQGFGSEVCPLRSVFSHAAGDGSGYAWLVEAALGKANASGMRFSATGMVSGYRSHIDEGNYLPDPNSTIRFKDGLRVPIGKVTKVYSWMPEPEVTTVYDGKCQLLPRYLVKYSDYCG